MKKLLILTNLFWISIFVFFSCTRNGGLQINSQDCQLFCYNYINAPFPGLKPGVAKVMADNYAKLYPALDANGNPILDANGRLNRTNGIIDMNPAETKSVWFSLTSIKNFIYQIERSTCQLKCDKVNQDNIGIRFYFAKYPQSTDTEALSSDFAFLNDPNNIRNGVTFHGRKTLFMVPTYNDPIQGDVDFDPRWSVTYNQSPCSPQTMKMILSNKEPYPNAIQQSLGLLPDPDGMQNHQPMCPPFDCPGQTY